MYKTNCKSITLILLISTVVLFSCSDKLPVINRFENQDEIATVTAHNVEMTYTEKGFKRGRLQADIFENYDMEENTYVKFPAGIKITLYDKSNKVETEMEADSALYYPDDRTWEATGNVIVRNINGTILRTEKLYGDESKKKIFTNHLVKITKTDGTIVVGKTGFVSNTEFTIYKFLNMYGRFYVKENPNDSIESEDKQSIPAEVNDQIYSPSRLPANMKKPENLKGKK